MKKFILTLVILIPVIGLSNNFGDKNYYLVDSLNLDDLNDMDKVILDENLTSFHSTNIDTIKAFALLNISNRLNHVKWKEYTYLLNLFLDSCLNNDLSEVERIFFTRYKGLYYATYSIILEDKGQMEEAIDYGLKSIDTFEELNIRNQYYAQSLNSVGLTLMRIGHYKKAMEYFELSISVYEELQDTSGIALVINSKAGFYAEQGQPERALEQFKIANALAIKSNDSERIATTLCNMAIQQSDIDIEESKKNFIKSIQIFRNNNNDDFLGWALGRYSSLLLETGEFEEAMNIILETEKLFNSIDDKIGLIQVKADFGNFYFYKEEYGKAITYLESALYESKQFGLTYMIENTLLILSKSLNKVGKNDRAYNLMEEYHMLSDSLRKDDALNRAIQQEVIINIEKKMLIKEQEEKELARKEKEIIDRRNNLQYGSIFMGIVLMFGIIISLGFVRLSQRIVEPIVFLAFLILFEFVLVFIEPYLGQYTDGEPKIVLMVNLIVALLIFPVHTFFERYLKKKLTKN